MANELFGREDGVVKSAEDYLEKSPDLSQEARQHFKSLLNEYQRLHKNSGRLMRMSDRSQLELSRARLTAEAATQEKAAFLATMSHEIRTPMNGVVGYIDLLVLSNLDEDQMQMANTIRSSALSLLTIIDDILDFSKIEAGKLELEFIPVRLRDLLEDVADSLAPAAQLKDIDIVAYVSSQVPDWLISDPVRLRQTLVNLAGNAIKFSKQHPDALYPGRDKVIIRCDLINHVADQAELRITVQDHGIGISQDQSETLFAPFTQADSSTTRRFGGTGLGLAISKQLINMMGGEIRVESVLGEGSDFIIELSLPLASNVAMNPDEQVDLHGLNVGLLDDSEILAELISDYLRGSGAETIKVDNWKEAANLELDTLILGPSITDEQIRQLSADTTVAMIRLISSATGAKIGNNIFSGHLGHITTLPCSPLHYGRLLNAVAQACERKTINISVHSRQLAMTSIQPPESSEMAENLDQLILVVDDNLTNLQVMIRQLAFLGYLAVSAEDGEKALEVTANRNIALVICDCHMPIMDGFEFTRRIRQQEAQAENGRNLPILAATAGVTPEEIDKCKTSGMDEVLTKPLQLEKLSQCLTKWLPLEVGADHFSTPEAQMPDPLIIQDSTSQPEDIDVITDGGNTDNGAGARQELDLTFLRSTFGDDDETIREILTEFVTPAQSNMDEIDVAYANHEAAKVGEAAHKFKSSARTIGAHVLADICEKLETAGKSDDWAVIDSLYPNMRSELDAAISCIENL